MAWRRRPSRRPSPRALPCPRRTSPPASLRNSPERLLALKGHIEGIDEEFERRFFARPEAPILASLPGMGPILGTEFLVASGDLCAFGSADQLAAYAGLVPAANDSGKRV